MNKRKVVIEVLKGIATVTECPEDVEVEIIEYSGVEQELVDGDFEPDSDPYWDGEFN